MEGEIKQATAGRLARLSDRCQGLTSSNPQERVLGHPDATTGHSCVGVQLRLCAQNSHLRNVHPLKMEVSIL